MATAEISSSSTIEVPNQTEEVWERFTTDEGLGQWMGEGATVDPRTDGLIVAPDPAGGEPRRGRIETIEAPHRLTFTWWPEANPEDTSQVSVELTPGKVGTRVTVVESLPAASSFATGASCSSSTIAVATTSGNWAWRLAMLACSHLLVSS